MGTSMIAVEPVKESEAEELFGVFGDWDRNYPFDYSIFRKSLEEIITHSASKILVAKDNDRIVGFVQIMHRVELGLEPYYEIVELLVKETERSKGVGKALLTEVEKIARKETVNEIKLSSQVHRSRAHVFYEVNGYQYYKISKFYEKKLLRENAE